MSVDSIKELTNSYNLDNKLETLFDVGLPEFKNIKTDIADLDIDNLVLLLSEITTIDNYQNLHGYYTISEGHISLKSVILDRTFTAGTTFQILGDQLFIFLNSKEYKQVIKPYRYPVFIDFVRENINKSFTQQELFNIFLYEKRNLNIIPFFEKYQIDNRCQVDDLKTKNKIIISKDPESLLFSFEILEVDKL